MCIRDRNNAATQPTNNPSKDNPSKDNPANPTATPAADPDVPKKNEQDVKKLQALIQTLNQKGAAISANLDDESVYPVSYTHLDVYKSQIMWIFLIIDAKPNTPIFESREKVCRFKDREPFASQVKAVNTIIGKNFKGKTLSEAIDKLRANNNVRDNMCQFDKLVDIINNYTDRDGKRVRLKDVYKRQ